MGHLENFDNFMIHISENLSKIQEDQEIAEVEA